jgi:hypothetical protein
VPRYLIDKKFVDVATQELDLALLCVGYLSFPGFDPSIDLAETLRNLQQGYYGFSDYAFAYWARHVERTALFLKDERALQDLVEAVSLFIEVHWSEPRSRLSIPKSTLERLEAFKDAKNFQEIACAIHVARRQLHATSKLELEDEVLHLRKVMRMVRTALEDTHITCHAPCNADYKKQFCSMYGSNIFKCPRINCTRFYLGFGTEQLRDDHVAKHERSFFCSFPGCHLAIIGCVTAKELQKHEIDAHGTIDLGDDTEFPELPQDKVSFNCTQCDAKFTRKHNLKIHMRTHDAPNERRYVCSVCGKGFSRQGDRTRHQSTNHSTKSFVCGGVLKNGQPWGCGRSFKRADVLARHYKSEKGRACRLPWDEEEALDTYDSSQPTRIEE